MTTLSQPVPIPATEKEIQALLGRLTAFRGEIGRVIVGQAAVLDELLIGFVAGGHVLLEGVPGLAKTLMIRTLADAADLGFHRIQFTPDLMPSDIVGTDVLEEDHGTGKRFFRFARGPVFANILLADEINRTPPKTQAALLEAMQEGAVTVSGTTYPLERPFFVLATQNPIEQAGTYPLPEAQLDRFLLYVRLDYPAADEEVAILERTTGPVTARVAPVVTGTQVLQLQALTREVRVSEALLGYVARLVRASRPPQSELAFVREWVRWGAGPRGGQSLVLAAKARALLAGRFAVTLDDLHAVAPAVLRHRLLLNFRAEADGIHPDQVIARLVAEVPLPASPLD